MTFKINQSLKKVSFRNKKCDFFSLGTYYQKVILFEKKSIEKTIDLVLSQS